MPLTSASTSSLGAQAAAMLRAFVREETGQDLVEYAFLAAFMATAGYVALIGIGPAVASAYASWLDPSAGVPSLWDPAPR
jgi:Flp pilus assembly pilin Flp